MSEYFTGDERPERIRRQRDLLQRPVGEIARKSQRERQKRGEQGGHPEHARPHRCEQGALGGRRERKQRNHDHVEQQLHAEFRARTQRDPEIAHERPAHSRQDGTGGGGNGSGLHQCALHARIIERTCASGSPSGTCVAATAVPPRATCSATMPASIAMPAASSAVTGSSRIHSGRLRSDNRARPMRRRWPCESTRAGSVRFGPSATWSSATRIESGETDSPASATSATSFSSAESSSFSAGAWPANAIAARTIGSNGATTLPSQRISPAAGRDRPASMRKSVVLTVPLAPVTTSACPASSRNDRPSNSRAWPRRAASSWASSMEWREIPASAGEKEKVRKG